MPPYKVVGAGTLEYFEGGGRSFRDLHFNHHCELRNTSLVVDGCVFATWEPGHGVTARFATSDDDATTEEIHSD
jgi:hypothetical protein